MLQYIFNYKINSFLKLRLFIVSFKLFIARSAMVLVEVFLRARENTMFSESIFLSDTRALSGQKGVPLLQE